MLITLANQKGGTGKTTLATNLAGAFAADRRRVVLVDIDPQRSALEWAETRPEAVPQIPVLSLQGAEDAWRRALAPPRSVWPISCLSPPWRRCQMYAVLRPSTTRLFKQWLMRRPCMEGLCSMRSKQEPSWRKKLKPIYASVAFRFLRRVSISILRFGKPLAVASRSRNMSLRAKPHAISRMSMTN